MPTTINEKSPNQAAQQYLERARTEAKAAHYEAAGSLALLAILKGPQHLRVKAGAESTRYFRKVFVIPRGWKVCGLDEPTKRVIWGKPMTAKEIKWAAKQPCKPLSSWPVAPEWPRRA